MSEAAATDRKMLSDPIPLEVPVARGSETIDILKLRRPSAGEMRGLNLADLLQMDITAASKLLPRIAVPPLTQPEVDALDPADFVAICTEMMDFFTPARMRPPS